MKKRTKKGGASVTPSRVSGSRSPTRGSASRSQTRGSASRSPTRVSASRSPTRGSSSRSPTKSLTRSRISRSASLNSAVDMTYCPSFEDYMESPEFNIFKKDIANKSFFKMMLTPNNYKSNEAFRNYLGISKYSNSNRRTDIYKYGKYLEKLLEILDGNRFENFLEKYKDHTGTKWVNHFQNDDGNWKDMSVFIDPATNEYRKDMVHQFIKELKAEMSFEGQCKQLEGCNYDAAHMNCKDIAYDVLTKNYTINEGSYQVSKFESEVGKLMLEIKYNGYIYHLDPELYFKKCKERKTGARNRAACHINLDIFDGEEKSGEYFTELFKQKSRIEPPERYGLICVECPKEELVEGPAGTVLSDPRSTKGDISSIIAPQKAPPFKLGDFELIQTEKIKAEAKQPLSQITEMCRLDSGVIDFIKFDNTNINKDINKLNDIKEGVIKGKEKYNRQQKVLLTSYENLSSSVEENFDIFDLGKKKWDKYLKNQNQWKLFTRIAFVTLGLAIGFFSHKMPIYVLTALTTGVGMAADTLDIFKEEGGVDIGLFEDESMDFKSSSIFKAAVNSVQSNANLSNLSINYSFMMFDTIIYLSEVDLTLEIYYSYVVSLIKEKPFLFSTNIGRSFFNLFITTLKESIYEMRKILRISDNLRKITYEQELLTTIKETFRKSWNSMYYKIEDSPRKTQTFTAQLALYDYLINKSSKNNNIGVLLAKVTSYITKIIVISNDVCNTQLTQEEKIKVYSEFLNLLNNNKLLCKKTVDYLYSDMPSQRLSIKIKESNYFHKNRLVPNKYAFKKLLDLSNPEYMITDESLFNELVSTGITKGMSIENGEYKNYVSKYLENSLYMNLENDKTVVNNIKEELNAYFASLNFSISESEIVITDGEKTYSIPRERLIYLIGLPSILLETDYEIVNEHIFNKIKSNISSNKLDVSNLISYYFNNNLLLNDRRLRIFNFSDIKDINEKREYNFDYDFLKDSNVLESIFINHLLEEFANTRLIDRLNNMIEQTFLSNVFSLYKGVKELIKAKKKYLPLFRNTLSGFNFVSKLYNEFLNLNDQEFETDTSNLNNTPKFDKLKILDFQTFNEFLNFAKSDSSYNLEILDISNPDDFTKMNYIIFGRIKNSSIITGFEKFKKDFEEPMTLGGIESGSYIPDELSYNCYILAENETDYICQLYHPKLIFKTSKSNVEIDKLSEPDKNAYFVNDEYFSNIRIYILGKESETEYNVKLFIPIVRHKWWDSVRWTRVFGEHKLLNDIKLKADNIKVIPISEFAKQRDINLKLLNIINKNFSVDQKCVLNYNISEYGNLDGKKECWSYVSSFCHVPDNNLSEDLVKYFYENNKFCDDCESSYRDCLHMKDDKTRCKIQKSNCESIQESRKTFNKSYIRDYSNYKNLKSKYKKIQEYISRINSELEPNPKNEYLVAKKLDALQQRGIMEHLLKRLSELPEHSVDEDNSVSPEVDEDNSVKPTRPARPQRPPPELLTKSKSVQKPNVLPESILEGGKLKYKRIKRRYKTNTRRDKKNTRKHKTNNLKYRTNIRKKNQKRSNRK